jgi:hypothetical protein
MLHWLAEELRSLAWLTFYFAACFVVIMLLKHLWLEEYGIAFSGVATALLAAVITAKVVIVLDYLPMTKWLQGLPGIVEVVTRSAIYTSFVLVVMIAEKAFESRAQHGGLIIAPTRIFDHPDMPAVLGSAIIIGLAFLSHNAFQIVRRGIGSKRMAELFLTRNAKINKE